MSNKIRVRRGSDTERKSATTIDDYEIHYSHTNSDGEGRPERLWVADSASAAGNSQDVLVGPYEFVSGDPRISVDADYTTGRVTIGYQDAATYNPTQSLSATAATYSANSVIEVGDSFGSSHTLTVANGSGANETRIDRAGYIFNNSTAYFASPLNAIDGVLLTSPSQSLSWTQTIAAPSNFSISSLANRRKSIQIFCDPPAGSGFNQDSSTSYFNWGWRVRGFASTTAYSTSLLPTASDITSTSGSNISMFNAIQQTPTSATVRTWTLPAGGPWFLYLVHTCSPDSSGDLYGWTPTATLVGSGAVSVTEVTDIAAGDFVQANGTIGGQTTTKYYRVWRIGVASGYAGNQSWSFSIA